MSSQSLVKTSSEPDHQSPFVTSPSAPARSETVDVNPNFSADDFRISDNKFQDHCGSRFAIRSGHLVRSIWELVVILLLLYTSTWFLFDICFLEFHVPEIPVIRTHEYLNLPEGVWDAWVWIYDALFWIDVIMNFLCTYTDGKGREVDSLRLIGKRYMKTYLLIDLLACVPESFSREVLSWFNISMMSTGHSSVAKVPKLARLNRISRLLRLLSLGRLAKMASMKKSKAWSWIQGIRSVRVVNFFLMLFFSVHILACGWYLVAALHSDTNATWLSRRQVKPGGENLTEASSPGLQWWNSMYYVLTVFTTVGFGDISPVTSWEIGATILIFMVGAVVHSILVGGIISQVTRVEDADQFVAEQTALIQHFVDHTELDPSSSQMLLEWAGTDAKRWMTHRYDIEGMKKLITGRYMSRLLMGHLPSRLYGGDLICNQFLKCLYIGLTSDSKSLPPRLPLLLALSSYRHYFETGEATFQSNDDPSNLFLVASGTFAFIGQPRKGGGIDAPQRIFESRDDQVRDKLFPYKLFGPGSFFGDYEVLHHIPRKASCRCEEEGSVLIVPRTEIEKLMGDFRQFAPIWIRESRWREFARQRSLRKLVRPRHLHDLAAWTIQRCYRNFVVSSRPKSTLAVSAGVDLGDCVHDASKANLVLRRRGTLGPIAMGDAAGSTGPDSLGAGMPDRQLSQVLQSLESISEAVRGLYLKVDELSAKVDAMPGNGAIGFEVV